MLDKLDGRRLGPYRLVREIGRGGMAVVYLGYHQTLRQPVAIKILFPHLTHDPSFVERFRREARVAARLRHPNIIHVHTVDSWRDLHYLVMDYADGDTLQQRLAGGKPLDWATVVSITRQMARALDYAHSQRVVHRDVKPSNILLTRDGRAILADFGIARATEETRLTLSGGYWGTPDYMSPEQALGGEIGPATDVYALGAVVYTMTTGRAPFKADLPLAVLHKQAYEAPPPPRRFNRRLSPTAETAILAGLAKDPASRFPSARALARALEGKGAVPPPAKKPPRPPGQPDRHRLPAGIWALGLLPILGLIALLVLFGLDILPHQTPTPTASAIPATVATDGNTGADPKATAPLPPVVVTWTPSPWPSPTSTAWPTPTPTVDAFRQEIESLLYRYRELKAMAIGRQHDVSQLPTVLRDAALKELENAAAWQRDHGAYYETTWHWMRIDWLERSDSDHARALVTYNETLLYYPEGWETPSTRRSCQACEYQADYRLERMGGTWYIVDKDVVE